MSILINLAAEFTGKKAFKDADKGIDKLAKSAKSLGKTLGVALSAAAVVAYGKASVKAFSEDEAAANRLATAVKNIGLSLFTQDVEDFIAKTEKSSAILDDKLRPAMQALLTTTGSFTKSQELLNNAITISRASGVDLATVSQDLANGYVGITKGLKKYNTGLTQSELKSKSFADVLGILLKNSAGAADAYLETTAYKMDAIGVASENAKEKIGMGLMDALAKLSGGTTTADAIKTIDNIATGINSITSAVGGAVGALVKMYGWLDRTSKAISEKWPDPFGVRDNKPKMKAGRSSSPAGTWARTKQQRDAEAAAAKRAKELAGLQKKQVVSQKALTAEQKKQAALKKAGSIFDLEQIGIIAALKGQLSNEDRKRLELQLALQTENVDEAKRLTLEIAKSQGLSDALARSLASLPDAKNPFAAWKGFLDELELQAKRIASLGGAGGSSGRNDTFSTLSPAVQQIVSGGGMGAAGSTSTGDVYITVNGSVLSDQDLVAAVQNGLQLNSLSGKPSDIGRIAGMFG